MVLRRSMRLAALTGFLSLSPAFAAPPPDAYSRLDLFPHERERRIVFSIEAPAEASVSLIGDFNAWDPEATPLQYIGNDVWQTSIDLTEGDHEYLFVVNGQRQLDASNPDEVARDDGSVRSRLHVLPGGHVAGTHDWSAHGRIPKRVTIHDRGHTRFSLGGDYSFQRVDGSTFWLDARYSATYDYAPDLEMGFGYGWESERVNFEATLEQPLLRGRELGIGFSFTDGTGYENQSGVGALENTLAALLFKHDFNDYYDIVAYEPFVIVRMPASSTLKASYAYEDYDSLTTQTNWSVFDAGRTEFRPNPPLFLLSDPAGLGGAGTLQAFRLDVVHDTRRARNVGTVGTYLRGFLEFGEGDFSYRRWIGEGRAYMRLGPPVHLAARFRAGGRFGNEAMPSQKMFYVGGLGTVNAHEFRSQVGDHELLGNVEYSLLFGGLNYGLTFLYDVGTAWNSTTTGLDETTLLQAVGVALKSSNDDFRVQVAKPVGAVDGDVETLVRIERTF